MEFRIFERFTQKAASFLFLLVFMSLFLYVLGNYQHFLDTTQERLLKIEHTTAMILSICLVFLGFVRLSRTSKSTGSRITFFIIMLFFAVLSVLLSILITAILVWIH